MCTDTGEPCTLLQKFCRKKKTLSNKATMPSNCNFYLNLVKIWKHDTFLWLKPVNSEQYNYDYLPG